MRHHDQTSVQVACLGETWLESHPAPHCGKGLTQRLLGMTSGRGYTLEWHRILVQVYRATWNGTQTVAVKTLKPNSTTQAGLDFLHEVCRPTPTSRPALGSKSIARPNHLNCAESLILTKLMRMKLPCPGLS